MGPANQDKKKKATTYFSLYSPGYSNEVLQLLSLARECRHTELLLMAATRKSTQDLSRSSLFSQQLQQNLQEGKDTSRKNKRHINWRLQYWAWHPHMETPYVLINTTYVFIIHSHPQSAKWHIQRHTVRHANISADTVVVTRNTHTDTHSLVGVMTHLALSSICLANEDL